MSNPGPTLASSVMLAADVVVVDSVPVVVSVVVVVSVPAVVDDVDPPPPPPPQPAATRMTAATTAPIPRCFALIRISFRKSLIAAPPASPRRYATGSGSDQGNCLESPRGRPPDRARALALDRLPPRMEGGRGLRLLRDSGRSRAYRPARPGGRHGEVLGGARPRRRARRRPCARP